MEYTVSPPAHPDALNLAQEYIRTNYIHDISLADIAAYVCLSPAYFSTLFTRETGTTFSDYLRMYRLEQSKMLLKNSAAPIHEIAASVGFRSAAYFIKNFSEAFGITPGTFRKQQ